MPGANVVASSEMTTPFGLHRQQTGRCHLHLCWGQTVRITDHASTRQRVWLPPEELRANSLNKAYAH